MKISETVFRGRNGIKLETEKLVAVILPGNGGKVGSLIVKSTGLELLKQVPGNTEYKDLTYDGDYCSADVYAFDDMFPTIDPWDNGKRVYADHGEVIRMPWKYEVKDGTLEMSVTSKFGEYRFGKTFSEVEDGKIVVSYKAENLTKEEFPFLWAAHMMLEVQKDAVIDYENENGTTAEVAFSSNDFLGKKGTLIKVQDGSDLLVNGRPEGKAFKYYVHEDVTWLKYGCFKLETENAPCLGVWMNNGEFHNFKNVAIEVCTGGYDTPGAARDHGQDIVLPADGRREWKIKLGTV